MSDLIASFANVARKEVSNRSFFGDRRIEAIPSETHREDRETQIELQMRARRRA
jgi:hypothetical protein